MSRLARKFCPPVSLAILLLHSGAALASAELRSYPVAPARLDAIQNALRPLISQSAKLSHLDGKLLVVAPTADHEIVESVLRELGGKTVQFVISIIQGASQAQVQKLLEIDTRNRSISVGSQPSETRIASVQLVAGQVATLRTERARPQVYSTWSGVRSSGVVQTEESLTGGFAVSAVPNGSRVEVTIEPVRSTVDQSRSDQRVSQSVSTRLVVPLDKWVKVYGSGRLQALAAG